MKRDMELVRTLMLGIEHAPGKSSWRELIPKDGNEGEQKLALAHLQLIREAGLIKGVPLNMGGHSILENIELTWDGHEFLDAVRDPDIWRKTKERTKGIASVGIQFLWEIAKVEIKAKLGLP